MARVITTGKFDTWEELYECVVNSMCPTQAKTAVECGCSPTKVSDILIMEKMRSKTWRGKHERSN